MRFFHTIQNMHFVIRAGWNEIDPVTRQPIRHRPLEAQFRRHQFDTETARRSLGWSDAEHEQVVEALNDPPQGSGPYNDRMTGRLNVDLDAHPDGHNFGPGGEKVTIAPKACMFTVITGEGSTLCSRPALAGDDYCETHREAINKQIGMAKAREAKAEKVSA